MIHLMLKCKDDAISQDENKTHAWRLLHKSYNHHLYNYYMTPVLPSRFHNEPYKMQSNSTLADLISCRPANREEWNIMWLAGSFYTRSHVAVAC